MKLFYRSSRANYYAISSNLLAILYKIIHLLVTTYGLVTSLFFVPYHSSFIFLMRLVK